MQDKLLIFFSDEASNYMSYFSVEENKTLNVFWMW